MIFARNTEARLVDALADSPVVLVHGARQCGKTTLARMVGDPRGYTYFSFDDSVMLAAAEEDPVGFVSRLPDRAILDEVQRVPGIFVALKSAVDRRRVSGRFLLTGSSNVLLLPKLSDSLAGRMEILGLFPLAQCELEDRKPWFLDALLGAGFQTSRCDRLGPDLAERITAGGYPAALVRRAGHRRAAWYRDYVETIVQRDVRELSRIRSLDILPRLLQLAAGQTARLVNIAELGRPLKLSRPTIHDYVTLLERVYLLDRLPPWHSNRLRRLVKTPKLHIGDTGVASALLGIDAEGLDGDRGLLGQLVETFVCQELRREASWQEEDIRLYHFRDKDGAEVDIVVESGASALAGVEVKASATVAAADFRGLKRLSAAAGERFRAGVVLYDGEVEVSFGDRLFAVPIRRLWEQA